MFNFLDFLLAKYSILSIPSNKMKKTTKKSINLPPTLVHPSTCVFRVCKFTQPITFGKKSSPSKSFSDVLVRSSEGHCVSNCIRLATRLNWCCCIDFDDDESVVTSLQGEEFYKELTETYR